MKNSIALSQAALNMAARIDPGALRAQREKAIAKRDQLDREHRERMAEFDALIERIGIALGEVIA